MDSNTRILVGNQLWRTILRLDNEGKTVAEIAHACGCDEEYVIGILRRMRN